MSSDVTSGRFTTLCTSGVLRYFCSPRCLAHIINLATQAVISTRTKSKYYTGDPADDHIPEDRDDTERDEIGLIQAICIKVR